MRQIVLDTETTGREVSAGHRIVEIGCLELIDRRITQRHFHCYLNPERDSEPGALAVHGLTTAFLQNKPVFSSIADALIEFIQGATLIIHNAPFDIGFLNNELKLTKKKYKNITDCCQILDSLPLARQLHPGQRNSLDALCKRYGIDNSKRDKHGALLDAELLAHVYLAMTGGQNHLFDNNLATRGTQSTTKDKHHRCVPDLYVLYANNKELQEHDRYLSAMHTKTGKCLWLKNDTKDTD